MSGGLTADLLFAYIGIITTATTSIYAGSFGTLPVRFPFWTYCYSLVEPTSLGAAVTGPQRDVERRQGGRRFGHSFDR